MQKSPAPGLQDINRLCGKLLETIDKEGLNLGMDDPIPFLNGMTLRQLIEQADIEKKTKDNREFETLPVAEYREQIVAAVRENPVVVIMAETGAGKSTQVPQYLLDAGYNVLVTQPRRLAAYSVAKRVAFEINEELGRTVGYRTAVGRCDSPETRCLFCTDGLALVRELLDIGRHNVLILDEVHEWNLNIEVLTAWAKAQIRRNIDYKIVLMSATLNKDDFMVFFNNPVIIDIPGRLHPIEERQAGESIVEDTAKLLKEGRNVLVFQPGKKDIRGTIAELQALPGLDAEILPLHSELKPDEQDLCFCKYELPKCVVSTNIAQTSITIPDIDAVVDSGEERLRKMADGIEGLYLNPISLADRAQRKGRAGRVKPGIFIDHCPTDKRSEFSKPEILRLPLENVALSLASIGIDAGELDFFHQPDKSAIKDAENLLWMLGCMAHDGSITDIGRRVAEMPISVRYARMIIEAEKLGVVGDVIAAAAILEQGGITAGKQWKMFCPDVKRSDVLAQLRVYGAMFEWKPGCQYNEGVNISAFMKARQMHHRLGRCLAGKINSFHSTGDPNDIVKAVCAGMLDHLYTYKDGEYKNRKDCRRLHHNSVIRTPGWIVGIPLDVETKTPKGKEVHRLIVMASKVKPRWLCQMAPHLVKTVKGIEPHYKQKNDSVYSAELVFFNGNIIGKKFVPDTEHPQAEKIMAKIAKMKKENK